MEHSIFLERVSERVGIKGTALKWIESYLTGRRQVVKVEGVSSDELPLNTGVPQGSVAGPIFFIMYILPLGEIIAKHGLNYMFYADDQQDYLGIKFESFKCSWELIKPCILDVRTWLLVNLLKNNATKTVFSLHGTSQQLAKLGNVTFELEGVEFVPQCNVKSLGVVFDASLSMKPQVNAVCKRAWHELHNINCIRGSLDKEAAAEIIHAFVTSHIDHSNALLYGLPKCTITKLQKVQNAAARTLTGLHKWEHITPVLVRLHWLPVAARVEFKLLTIVYKCLYSNGPEYLKDLLVTYTPSRSLRSSDDSRLLLEPRTKLSTGGDRSFHKAAPVLWNKLPHEIRHSISLSQFKSRLKKHLFVQSYPQQSGAH